MPPKNTGAEQCGLWLAVLLHTVVIAGVTIVFRAGTVSRKPEMVFLGAVLDKQDLTPHRTLRASPGAPPDGTDPPLIIESPESHHSQDVPKPRYTGLLPDQAKRSLKTDFLVEDPAPRLDGDLPKIGIDLRPPPRPRMREGLRETGLKD